MYYSVILLIRRNVHILFFGVSKKYRLQHLFHIQKGSDLISFSKTVLKIKRAILPVLRFDVGQSRPRMTKANFGVAMRLLWRIFGAALTPNAPWSSYDHVRSFDQLSSVNSHHYPDFKFVEVSEAYVGSLLRQLKTGKAVGLDNIPARLLVDSADIVAKNFD